MRAFIVIVCGLLITALFLFYINSEDPIKAQESEISITAGEFDGEKIAFAITREDVSVSKSYLCYTVSGTALETVHFTPVKKVLRFAEGDREKTIDVYCGDAFYPDYPHTVYVSSRVQGRTFYLALDDGDIYRGEGIIPTQNTISSDYFSSGYTITMAGPHTIKGEREYLIDFPAGYFLETAERKLAISYTISALSGTLIVSVASDINSNYQNIAEIKTATTKTHSKIAFNTASRLKIKFEGTGFTVSDLKVTCTATDTEAPKLIDFFLPKNYDAGQPLYISAVFDEIIGRIGTTAQLVTTAGTLTYLDGAGTNVIVFSGVFDAVPETIALQSLVKTVQDYSSNQAVIAFTGEKEFNKTSPTVEAPQPVQERLTYNGMPQSPELLYNLEEFSVKTFDKNGLETVAVNAGAYTLKIYYEGEEVSEFPFDIFPMEITATAEKIVTKVYDGTDILMGTLGYNDFIFSPAGGCDILPAKENVIISVGKFDKADVSASYLSVEIEINDPNFILIGGTLKIPAQITRRIITVSSQTEIEKTYDGNTLIPSDMAVEIVIGNAIGSINVALTAVGFSSADVLSADSAVFTVEIEDNNHILEENSLTVNARILPKEISVLPILTLEKVYDGTTNVGTELIEGTHYRLEGAIGEVEHTLTEIKYNSANVGASNVHAKADINSKNYFLTENTVAFSAAITPKDIFARQITVLEKVFDGTTAFSDGIVQGTHFALDGTLQEITAEVENAHTDEKSVLEAKKVYFTLKISDSNYSLNGTGNSAELIFDARVLQRELTINALMTLEKVYDGNVRYEKTFVTGEHFEAVGLVDGTSVNISSAKFNSKDVLLASRVTAGVTVMSTDYTVNPEAVFPARILPRPVDIQTKVLEKVYDGNFEYGKPVTASDMFMDAPIENITFSLMALPDCAAGEYEVEADVSSTETNYSVPQTLVFTVRVLPKEVEVYAHPQETVYGEISEFSFDAVGLLEGDTLSGGLYSEGINAGVYPILSGLNHPSYEVIFTSNIHIVLPRAALAVAKETQSVYGDEIFLECETTNILAGDNLNLRLFIGGAIAGEYDIQYEYDNENYAVEFVSARHTVLKRTARVIIPESESVYGENIEIRFNSENILAGDSLAGRAYIESFSAGIYPILFEHENENYTIDYQTAYHTIRKREVTVKASGCSFIFGERTEFTHTVLEGSILPDDMSLFVLGIDAENAGEHEIHLMNSSEDYEVNYHSGECVIFPRPIKIILRNQTAQYGNAAVDQTAYEVEGEIFCDPEVYIFRTEGNLPGEYRLFAAAECPNYRAEIVGGKYTILKADSRINVESTYIEKTFDGQPLEIGFEVDGDVQIVLTQDGKIRENSFTEAGRYQILVAGIGTEVFNAPVPVSVTVVIKPVQVIKVTDDGAKVTLVSDDGFDPDMPLDLVSCDHVEYSSIWRQVLTSYQCSLPGCEDTVKVTLQLPPNLSAQEKVTVLIHGENGERQVDLEVIDGKISLELSDGQTIAFLSEPKIPETGIIILAAISIIVLAVGIYMMFVAR